MCLTHTEGLTKRKTNTLLTENPGLYLTNKDDLEDSLKMLERLQISTENLAQLPSVLCHKANVLETRYQSLDESGFKTIDLNRLSKYIYIMNKNIHLLKTHAMIDRGVNVAKKLGSILDVSEDEALQLVNEKDPLIKNRERLLLQFFKRRLQLGEHAALQFKETHIPRIRHKSFQQVTRCLHLLVNEFRFSDQTILDHPFVLNADPNNMEKVLYEVKTIFGHDVREIAATRPIFLMTNWKSIIEIIEILQNFNISHSSLHYVLTLFALEPETVSQRLDELKSIEELSVLKEHPQVLRLIYYQNKALHRLGYLKQMKVKCPSINVLSGHTEIFEKFVRSASDGSKTRQIIFFLSKLLDIAEDDLRLKLKRHTNWAHVSVLSLRQSVECLLNAGFDKSDIRDNIILAFYPK